MKKPYKIILILSLTINLVLLGLYLFGEYQRSQYKWISIDNEVNIPEERKKFISELRKKHPELAKKEFYFINVWDPGDWVSMQQMPVLDTLLEPLRNNFAYIFVCGDKTDYAWLRLKQYTFKTRNFVYMNDQRNFVTSIFQEKGMLNNRKYRWNKTPYNLVMDSTGKILVSAFSPLPVLPFQIENSKITKIRIDSLGRAQYENYVARVDSITKIIQ